MRIEMPVPALPPVATTPPAGLRLERAALAPLAALAAAATPWTALDALVADRLQAGGGGAPAAVPPAPPTGLPAVLPPNLPSGLVAAAGVPVPALPPAAGLPGTAAPPALPSLPSLPSLATLAGTAAGALPVAGPDRLSLSALAAAPRLGTVPGASGPVGDFLGRVLQALTGDEAGALRLTALGAPPEAAAATVAGPAGRLPQDLLQLLLRGSLSGADRQQVEVTLGLTVLRQAPAGVLVDAAVLDAVRGALEQLARREVELDFPGPAAALAGQSLRFQASFDPQTLWPMQSFLLSGLLIFGRARAADDEEAVEARPEGEDGEGDGAAAQASDQDEASGDQGRREPPPRPAPVAEEPTPLPADGGAPIISAGRWLELELRHWQVQLRRWMALPPPA